jgi:hypothetical protein
MATSTNAPGGRRGPKSATGEPGLAPDQSTQGQSGTDAIAGSTGSYGTGASVRASGTADQSKSTSAGSVSTSETQRGPNEGGGLGQILRDGTRSQLDSQKERATQGLNNLAGVVRGTTEQLREGGQTKAADYVARAADQIEHWSSTLRNRELDDVLNDLQDFARRQPALFLGTAFGIGLLAARFLKSSGERPSYRASGASGWSQSSGRGYQTDTSRQDLYSGTERSQKDQPQYGTSGTYRDPSRDQGV